MRLLLWLCLLLALLWLAPAIVSKSPLRDWAVSLATRNLPGEVRVRSLSLDWFKKPVAEGVEFLDDQGELLATIEHAETDRTLFSLALAQLKQPLRITLQGPTVQVLVEPGNTNVEAYWHAIEWPKGGGEYDVTCRVIAGKVQIKESQRDQGWRLRDVEGELRVKSSGDDPLKLKVSAKAEPFVEGLPDDGADDDFGGGVIELAASWEDALADMPGKGALLGVADLENVPLGALNAVATRFNRSEQHEGQFTGRVTLALRGAEAWTRAVYAEQWDVDASGNATQITVDAPWMGEDRFVARAVEASCRVGWSGDRLQIGSLRLASDLGRAEFAGTADLSAESWPAMLERILRQPVKSAGRVNAARLVEMMPSVFRLREGVEVTSGVVAWDVAFDPGVVEDGASPAVPSDAEGGLLRAFFELSSLQGVRDGRPIMWESPVRLAMRVQQSETAWTIEQLQCEADFITATATGDSQALSASLAFDMRKLVEHVGQFADLGGFSPSGNASAQLEWKRGDDSKFSLVCTTDIDGFELARGNETLWSEPKLSVSLTAAGDAGVGGLDSLRTATLQASNAAESLSARLLEPVVDPLQPNARWSFDVDCKTDLGKCGKRLTQWGGPLDWAAEGNLQLAGRCLYDGATLQVASADAAVANLKFVGAGVELSEPVVRAAVRDLAWNGAQRRLSLATFTADADSTNPTVGPVSFGADNLVVNLPADQQALPQVSGLLRCNADLRRITRMTAAAPTDETTERLALEGMMEAAMQFQHAGDVTAFTLQATASDLRSHYGSLPPIEEKTVNIEGDGRYLASANMLQLNRLAVTSNTINGSANGQVQYADDASKAECRGQFDCDWSRIAEFMRPYTGDGVFFQGKHACPFSYAGPLPNVPDWSDTASAQVALGWEWGNVYGFELGPARIKASLADQECRFASENDISVSAGKLKTLPIIRRSAKDDRWELTATPGVVVEEVRINKQMCSRVLQYITPVLAGITEAQGTFSIELTGCHVPLDDPAKADIAGRLLVHDLEIGPGPLIRELALLLQVPQRLAIARSSVVTFRMVDGRIFHRDLQLVFPDMTVQMHGSVGLDKTIALMVTMPVPEKWVGDDRRVSAALRGQTITIPINGTLSKPRLDQQAMGRLSEQFLRKAAEQVIQDELRNQLDRLFKP